MFSYPGSVLPIQSTAIWCVYSICGVHGGGERGQTDCLTKEYKNLPVPRQLVGQSQIPPNVSLAYTNSSTYLSGVRLFGQHEEVRTGLQASIPLRSLPFRPERGQGQTTLEQ